MAVGGEQGATGGFVIPSHLDEMMRRVAVRMCLDGHVERGGFPPRDAPPGLFEAYTLAEAVEVRTESGELIGYWANHFVPLSEYEALLPDARALIVSSRKPR